MRVKTIQHVIDSQLKKSKVRTSILDAPPGRNLKDESVRGTKRAIFLRGGVERMKRVSKFRISYGVLEKGQFSRLERAFFLRKHCNEESRPIIWTTETSLFSFYCVLFLVTTKSYNLFSER